MLLQVVLAFILPNGMRIRLGVVVDKVDPVVFRTVGYIYIYIYIHVSYLMVFSCCGRPVSMLAVTAQRQF